MPITNNARDGLTRCFVLPRQPENLLALALVRSDVEQEFNNAFFDREHSTYTRTNSLKQSQTLTSDIISVTLFAHKLHSHAQN